MTDMVFWSRVLASVFGMLVGVLYLMIGREVKLRTLSIVLLIASICILIETI